MVLEKYVRDNKAEERFKNTRLQKERSNNLKIRKIHDFLDDVYLACLETPNIAISNLIKQHGLIYTIKDVLLKLKILKVEEPTEKRFGRNKNYFWIINNEPDVKMAEKVAQALTLHLLQEKKEEEIILEIPIRNLKPLDVLSRSKMIYEHFPESFFIGEIVESLSKRFNLTEKQIRAKINNFVSVGKLLRSKDGKCVKIVKEEVKTIKENIRIERTNIESLLEVLPNSFTTADAIKIFNERFNIVDYITKERLKNLRNNGLIIREGRGLYRKSVSSPVFTDLIESNVKEITQTLKSFFDKTTPTNKEREVKINIAKLHASIGEYKMAYDILITVMDK